MLSQKKMADLGLLALRITTGVIFLYFGWMKLAAWQAPATDAMTWITRILFVAEVVGGAAVLVGFLTRWAGLGLSIIMVGAIYFHISGLIGPQATAFMGGWSFPFAILGGTLALAGLGGGCIAWDGRKEWKPMQKQGGTM